MPARKDVKMIYSQWKILNNQNMVPMKDIENSIEPQKKYVMCCDVLHIFELVDHVQLWQNREGLQPDTEGPDEVSWVQRFVDNYGHKQREQIDVSVWERV